ncbi:MAG: GDP-mannose 4,6-dehydratase [Elusimicrobia bacterium]|nr:GDP-mannose 4,6-dehydratase [Elusimicrobiota bacterium]
MAKKAFITGILGQDGSYLSALLLRRGYKIYGSELPGASAWRHAELGIAGKARIYTGLKGFESLRELFGRIKPDEVYNLGSQSSVRNSFARPLEAVESDAVGTARLLEAIRRATPRSLFFQATSGLIFSGPGPDGKGRGGLMPQSPYACAKLYSHWLTLNYREFYGIFAVSGILYNHESPLRGENFVTRKIAMAVAGIKKGAKKPLQVGNINVRRDWGYAAEYAEGMRLALAANKPGDYVFATGKTHSVREFIEAAFRAAGMRVLWKGEGLDEKGVDAENGGTLVEISPKYFRPHENKVLEGDPSKTWKAIGWRPKTDFEALASMMVKADSAVLKRNRSAKDVEICIRNQKNAGFVNRII